ncbi:tetratricopeptide repeat protein, partial [Neisseria dumasiana]
PLVFSVAVKELEKTERNGLLRRYLSFQEISSLSKSDLQFFSDLLTGYPQQVFFAVDQIKDNGIFQAKKNSHLIQQYASDKAKVIFDSYKNNSDIQEFIILLARFEFISYEVLFEIVDESTYFPMLQELLANSICEHIGKASEYIRVNEVLRDYISRSRFELNDKFQKSIEKYSANFIQNVKDDNFDISGYLLSAQEILLAEKDNIPEQLIIPSIFIRAVKKLYDEDRNYDDAISLASRVLNNERTLHINTINYIRFLKCQALARVRKYNDFFDEVNKLTDKGEQDFLKGFYYRLQGKNNQAEKYLNDSLNYKKYNDPKVIGELIRIYMQNEDYEKAFIFSKENYEKRPGNIINANDYFNCILMLDDSRVNKKTLEYIINNLSIDPSEKAKEVVLSMRARVCFFYEDNKDESFRIINEAISSFPKISYPLLTKADLAIVSKDISKLSEAVKSLEHLVHKHAQTYRSFIRYKAYLLTMEGKLNEALRMVDAELQGLNQVTIDRFKDKLRTFTLK